MSTRHSAALAAGLLATESHTALTALTARGRTRTRVAYWAVAGSDRPRLIIAVFLRAGAKRAESFV